MNRYALLALIGCWSVGGCPQAATTGATTTSGSAAPAATASPAASVPAEKGAGAAVLPYALGPDGRYINPDGRVQAADGAGNPMFDADRQPVWEPPPAEQARQLFEEAVMLQKGIAGAEPNEVGALQRLSRAVELVPGFSEAWYNLGRLQLKMNNLAQAKVSLKKAKDLDPKRVEVYVALGLAMERGGEFSPALSVYELGLQQASDNVDLLNGIARVLRNKGQVEEAIRKAKAILLVNSNSLDAYNTLGLCYLDRGDLELARFVFLKAEGSVPGGAESASIQANMGLVFFRMGREFAAEERFNAARQLDPDHVGAMVNLAYLKLKNYDFEGARALLQAAHQVLPASNPIKLNLAVSLRGTGDVDGARRLYEEIIASNDEIKSQALLNLGILQADFDKDFGTALATYSSYIAERSARGQSVGPEDPVQEYIKEADRAKKREDKQKERDAKKKSDGAASSPGTSPGVVTP